jgi:pimeloyl-ACP methyl ester carboxylesterase
MNFTNFPHHLRRSDDTFAVNMVLTEDDQQWIRRPTVITIHGWTGYYRFRSTSSLPFQMVADHARNYHNVNVIRANWKNGFWIGYQSTIKILESIGRVIAKFIDRGFANCGDFQHPYTNLTIIGHDLGAHIAGWVGRMTKHKIGTIIGLDPASE